VEGVVATSVGYTGGENAKPSYESVCGGDGHTEAIRIEYDPDKISYDQLLDEFYRGHTPMGGKQQYMSAVWYHNEEQKQALETRINAGSPLVHLEPAKPWHDAEEYHQKYYIKKGCTVQ